MLMLDSWGSQDGSDGLDKQHKQRLQGPITDRNATLMQQK